MNSRPIRVLLIDGQQDEQVISNDLLSQMHGSRFSLEQVTSYDQAVEALGRKEHDVCLLNYRFGQCDGLKLLQEATAQRCKAPVILLISQADRQANTEALKAGAADCLVTGQLDVSQLERSIRYALQRHSAQAALRASEGMLEAVVEAIGDHMSMMDKNGTIIWANDIARKRFGSDMVGRKCYQVYHKRKQPCQPYPCPTLQAFDDGKTHEHNTKVTDENGEIVYFHCIANVALRNEDGSPIGVIEVSRNITDQKHFEKRLQHDAFHDPLTNLPNRALFMDRLKHAIKQAGRRKDYLFALLFLDLDRFKLINDSLGHVVGDRLLAKIARRFEKCLRDVDTVARLGGDEFGILLDHIKDADDAVRVAQRIQKELAMPFSIKGQEIFITASIGIVGSPGDQSGLEELMRQADMAMYQAKLLGKARYEVFDKSTANQTSGLLQLETDLRLAVQRAELYLGYQPIVSLETGKTVGFEALVRWRHPKRGTLVPADFLSMAEETGLIIPIGQWVLHQACRQMRQWQERFPITPPLSISVNFSPRQLLQDNLILQIEEALRQSGLDANSLHIEVPETLAMENIELVTTALLQLKSLNVQLYMDDFGTGYSSLSRLHHFPIDTLKIDRSFIARMDKQTEDLEIVRAIVLIAGSLKMDVIAEGIETAQQLRQLQALGCQYGQGFYFAKAMESQAAEQWIAQQAQPAVELATR